MISTYDDLATRYNLITENNSENDNSELKS